VSEAPSPPNVHDVGSGGLIYAVIVALWAVVLVPVWLRRHDEVSETRSVDRFQGAMRTLSRRDAAGDHIQVVVPRRTRSAALPDGFTGAAARAADAAARRRRTGLVLTVAVLLVALVGGLGLLPWWAALVPLAMLVLFLVQTHVSARRAHERGLAARRAKATAARRARRELAEASMPDVAVRPSRPAREPETSQPEPVAAPAAAEQPHEFFDAEAARAWDPVPVPLPTYVSAPMAPRTVRVIDLTAPGAWTSGHLAASEVAPDIDPSTADPDGAPAAPRHDGIVTGEVLVERRRAVGD
jgi:uncharacterized membrane protein